jgi:hypothetical protein
MEHNQNDFARPAVREEGHVTPSRCAPHALSLEFEPIHLEPRGDGWSPARQRAFIEELADCGVVREAAARVGMSEQSARRLRRRDDAASFNIAWEAALQHGADRLRSVAFERAVEGVIRPRFYHGEKVGEERVYDNRLLLALLARAERLVPYADQRRAVSDWGRWMEAIEDGDPPPPRDGDDVEEPRIWQDEAGRWWTDFPPPLGFTGDHRGDPRDDDYCRACVDGELAAIGAMEAREDAIEHKRRDAYFARLMAPG